ncbi:lactonase family protein [Luteolibacter algae]|uniref:Lactonase family protein n=1 Tax=Luteolibacter algae TaxID=454151 RepID=A0ABW5D6S4_9BACT
MKSISALLLSTVFIQAQPVFIGTSADGIYLSDFDATNGVLTAPERIAEYKSPGFLAFHPEKPILYAVGGDNKVAGFTIDDGNTLEFLGEADAGGVNPCHLAIDASGRTVALANYGDGSFTTIRIDADGKPGEIVSLKKISGSGAHPQRQKAAHAHGVYFDNANRFLLAPDLGTDQVLIYKFDPATSKIEENQPSSLKTAPGAGPRHMTFSADEKHAYVLNEINNSILVAEYDAASGSFKEIQTIPTLPDGFTERNTTAEIEVHPGGDFVYASNRGHDSIAVFKRDQESGKLTFVQHAPCGGKIPRHFKIDPSGKWLLCGHQDSDTISVLGIDEKTGKLGEPKNTVKAPRPICLLFR